MTFFRHLFRKKKNGDRRSIYCLGFKIFEYSRKKTVYREQIDRQALSAEISGFHDLGITPPSPGLTGEKLIVSLTSYPARMGCLHFVLYSLLTQTLKPDELVLWLASSQFPNGEKDIPEKVLDFRKNGLTIKWCEDLRSYKKIIPVLREFPDDIVVTADDDLFYERDWLERLYTDYLKHKGEKWIFSHRNHGISFSGQEINPFELWLEPYKNRRYEPTSLNFCTTGAGILCPPHIFYKDVLDERLFFYLAPFHDDLWLWAMALLNGAKIKQVENNIPVLKPVSMETEMSNNGETLYSINRVLHNVQFRYICQFYPKIRDILLADKEIDSQAG